MVSIGRYHTLIQAATRRCLVVLVDVALVEAYSRIRIRTGLRDGRGLCMIPHHSKEEESAPLSSQRNLIAVHAVLFAVDGRDRLGLQLLAVFAVLGYALKGRQHAGEHGSVSVGAALPDMMKTPQPLKIHKLTALII